MSINSIRLQNFKGFKDATLQLKPLTVILGPNSAGKSCFGQALVALSKHNFNPDTRTLSLTFPSESPFSLGKYDKLVHTGCNGEPVIIELGLKSKILSFGFGGAISKNQNLRIGELDLTRLEIAEKIEIITSARTGLLNTTETITTEASFAEISEPSKKLASLERRTVDNWALNGDDANQYKVFFNKFEIVGAYKLTGTTIQPKDLLPVTAIEALGSALNKVSHLEPVRMQPKTKYLNEPYSTDSEIGPNGEGTVFYLNKYYFDKKVDTFDFPTSATEADKAAEMQRDIARIQPIKKDLGRAVSEWLNRLGLAESIETTIVDGGRNIEVSTTLPQQKEPRDLTNVGFGVSQALPILVKGLSVEKDSLYIVEQPEAQLHPKPQAELADFFCSLVKCDRNVLIETHSEALFHRLRVLASMDENLADKIAVYFIDEPKIDTDGTTRCSKPWRISLVPGNELKWPAGFLYDGVEAEMQVHANRVAKKRV